MSKSKSKPTNSRPRMKKVNALIKAIQAEEKYCEEYSTSEDSCLADYVSGFGYGEGEVSYEYVDDEVKETLNSLIATNQNWRRLVLEFCEVKLVGIHYEDNAIFGATIGEQEHQLGDEVLDAFNGLNEVEQKLVVDATYIRNGQWIYTSHYYDRFVLVLDAEKFLERYPPNSIKVFGPLKLVHSSDAVLGTKSQAALRLVGA